MRQHGQAVAVSPTGDLHTSTSISSSHTYAHSGPCCRWLIGTCVMDVSCQIWEKRWACAQQGAVDNDDEGEPGVEVGPKHGHVRHGCTHLDRKHRRLRGK